MINSITRTSITEIELEENIRRKELTPAELSKEMVRKAVQVAPALPSAVDGKKPRGEKRTYTAPKVDVAQAIGVSKGTPKRANTSFTPAGNSAGSDLLTPPLHPTTLLPKSPRAGDLPMHA